MALGRPKGAGTPFFCRNCQITTLLKKAHLKSVAHLQNRRFRALFQKPCISFSEIGRRLGLTRERVRQLAERFGAQTGRERQYVCAVNERPGLLPPDCLALKAEKICQEKGLRFEFADGPGRGYRRLSAHSVVVIEGQKCVLRHSTQRESGNIMVRKPERSAKDAAFLLSYVPDGRWLIIPKDRWPRSESTEFRPSGLQKPGAKTKRHDWPSYIDAWSLLKNEENA
jgi:hypothetical protein